MQGRPRKRKFPLLGVVSARRVWRNLHWLNLSPSDLKSDPNERELDTLGPASRAVQGEDDSIHRCGQIPDTRDIKGERDA